MHDKKLNESTESQLLHKQYQIRANYDADSIVIYQAYNTAIAGPAIEQQKFVLPFSLGRMTWIKPSFLWLMHRSNWGQKNGQENILAVRIKRSAWNKALSLGVLTHPEPSIYADAKEWDDRFEKAHVHIQWDTERSLRGAALNYYSIQVGITRHLIQEYVDDWVLEIEDISALVQKIRTLLKSGKQKNIKQLLPRERVYPVDMQIGKHIMIS